MAKQTLQGVVDKLVEEGQLTRESSKDDSSKLEGVLLSVSESIVDQTVSLQQLLNLNENTQERIEEQRRLAAADGTPTVAPQPAPSADPPSGNGNEGRSSILASVFGGTFFGTGFARVLLSVGKVLGSVKLLFKSLAVGGVIGIAIYGISEVLKDIGENEQFQSALTSISSLWNDKVLPTFNRIEDLLANISGLGEFAERLRTNVQDFVVNTLLVLSETVGSIFEGINQMLDGDFLGGTLTILKGLGTGLLSIFDSLVTNVLNIFGVDFAEDGSFFGILSRKWSEMTQGVSDVWDNITTFIGEKFESFKSFMSPIIDAFSVITDIFTLDRDDMSALGALGKLKDIVFAPVNMAINFVKGIFGFDSTGEPFKLQDFVTDKANEIFEWIGDLFSSLPSIEGMKAALYSRLPEWMKPDSIDEQRQSIISDIQTERDLLNSGDTRNWRGQKRTESISNLERELDMLPQYNRGSSGFMNFGMGTPAMLHGIEAVVPKNSPAGAFLSRNFDENFDPINRRIQSIESSAMSGSSAPVIIASAPTIAPVTNNVRGSTNYSSQRITAVGNGSSGSGLGRFAN